MIQFYMNREEPLTPDKLGKILSVYQTGIIPTLIKRYNYYTGKQDILNRIPSSEDKPNNRIVTNFIKNIVETYEGYAVGIPITYSSDLEGFEELLDIFKYNDVVDEDAELFRKGLIFGRAPEICYFDESGKVRFKALDPRECLPIYEDTLGSELLYAVRMWQTNPDEPVTSGTYYVEVYDSKMRTLYRSTAGYLSFEYIEQVPHNFGQVPVTFFSLNDEEEGLADSIFTLQDAYNSLLSDSINDWDSFCDAYLMLIGCTAEAEDLAAMRKERCLTLPEGADARFLIKNTQTTEIEHLLTTVEEKIREIACCPNFASETFGTSSGIAIRYRLMGMSNRIKAIESNFRKALQRRIELIAGVSSMINGQEALWRDADIEFADNIPQNLADVATEVNAYRGLVSDKTLLSQIPFVTDVEAELEQIAKEKAESVEIYQGFGFAEEEDGEG